jgi:hypothetical protein
MRFSLIADIIFWFVLSPAHTHVTVNGIETLSNCTASLDVGLFNHNNFFISTPVAGFISRAAATKSSTNDEYI